MTYPPEKTKDPEPENSGTFTGSSSNPFRDRAVFESIAYDPPVGPPPAYVDREVTQPQHASSPSLQIPQAGPSNRSPSPGLKAKLAGTTALDVLNPPPPCFTRPAPNSPLMSTAFPPCTLISIDSKLENGFPLVAPPSSLQPHPFVVHDVKEEDWLRLLNDIKTVGALSPMNKIVSGVAPLAMGVGIFPGVLISRALERGMSRKKQNVASSLVEHWNFYFFHPRQLEVTLTQGPVVHAGMSDLPPGMPQHQSPGHKPRMEAEAGQQTYFRSNARYSSDSSDSSSSSSSDSDSNDEKSRGMSGKERKEMKRQIKQEKKERRREKKQERKERKSEGREKRGARRQRKRAIREARNEKWKLIVSFRPLAT